MLNPMPTIPVQRLSPNRCPASTPTEAPDFDAIKARQQATWAAGDFAVIGVTLQSVGEDIAEAVDLRAGERVVDVAAGNGNATLAAARRFARVTSTDYVPALLEKGRARVEAEGFDVDFRFADAEALPFADSSFDVALSTFGVIFAPNAPQAARELLRVVRPGGRIGMANWTPEGFVGQMSKLVAGYVPPPPGLRPPVAWGTEPHVVELFGRDADSIRCVRKHFKFRYRSAGHWLQLFRDFLGPIQKAFAALDAPLRERLAADITALLERLNVGGPASLVVPGEYLEVVVVRR
jgi:ubiquinone/menaquinone biosynthesis C-methylase UbiE